MAPWKVDHMICGYTAGGRYLKEWTTKASDELDVDLSKKPLLPTTGPAHRYQFALFIEKEGFNELLKTSQIAERFDLAIMSTKGMSNTAARLLVERLSNQGVTILVARDFDVSGFSIVQTLRSSNRRYRFRSKPNVIDLGLRLDDATALGLDSEPVDYRNQKDPAIRLRECGATEDECDYLVAGECIELNAMDSAQFIEWLEERLDEAGVTKVVPEADVVTTAYRRAVKRARVQQTINEILDEEEAVVEVPENLKETIRDRITGTADSWDQAIWSLAVDAVEEES